MNKENYKKLVQDNVPKENILKNGLTAFVVGGLIGLLGEVLMELYSYYFDIPTAQASIFMIVTLIFLSCLLTCFGFFDKWVHNARCGLIVPISGFAHAMMSAALEYRREGMVTGLGANMFKLAGSVIVFGVVSAYTFGIIRFIIYGG